MAKYSVKRFLLMFPTLVGVATLIFFLMRVVPGDIVELRFAGESSFASEAQLAQERARFGLDRPLWRQFVEWMWGLARLDFGRSMWTGAAIAEEIKLRFMLSLELAVMATIVAVLLARHRADPGVAHHLQMAAAHDLHAAVGGSLAEPRAAHLARARGRVPLLGGRDAHDAFRDAGGAPRGLHPHRPRQGARGEADPEAPRAQERDAAGADGHLYRVRLPHGRPRRHRAGVQPERPRAPVRPVGGPPRLHAHPGPRAPRGGVLHRRELLDGPDVLVARPAHPVPVGAMAINPSIDSIAEAPAAEARPGWVSTMLTFAQRRPLGAVGALVVILMLVVAVSATYIAPYDPLAVDFVGMLAPPSAGHWLGTDSFGRDVLSRLIYGSRTALLVGFGSALLGATAG